VEESGDVESAAKTTDAIDSPADNSHMSTVEPSAIDICMTINAEQLVLDKIPSPPSTASKTTKASAKKYGRQKRQRSLKAHQLEIHPFEEQAGNMECVANTTNAIDSPRDDSKMSTDVLMAIGNCITSGKVAANKDDPCGYIGPDEVLPQGGSAHPLCPVELQEHVVLLAKVLAPVSETISESETSSNILACGCNESSFWGCARHRTYAKELLLCQRSLRVDGVIGADCPGLFTLMAEPPGLPRPRSMRW